MINSMRKETRKNGVDGIVCVCTLTLLFLTSLFPGYNLLYYNRQYFFFTVLLFSLIKTGGILNLKPLSGSSILICFAIMGIAVSYANGMTTLDCLSPLYFIVCCVIANLIVGRDDECIEKNLTRFSKVLVGMYIVALAIYLPMLLTGYNTSVWVYASYIFGALLPFVLWSSLKGRTKAALYVLGAIAVLAALKRGPLLCIIAVLVIYLGSIILSRHYSLNTRCAYLLLLICCAGIIVFLAMALIDSTENNTFIRLMDIQNELDNSRGPLVEETMKAYQSSSAIEKAFGHGFNSVKADNIIPSAFGSLSSHNDFVEILYNLGFVGMSMYIIFLLCVLRAVVRLCKMRDSWGYILLASFVTFMIQSNVSHLYLYNYIFHIWIITWICGMKKTAKRSIL